MAAEKIGVTVMVEESHRDRIHEVARRLTKKGFELGESLEAIGVITGSATEGMVDELSKVAGVANVERNRDDYRPQKLSDS